MTLGTVLIYVLGTEVTNDDGMFVGTHFEGTITTEETDGIVITTDDGTVDNR